jgi:hypothetical protein
MSEVQMLLTLKQNIQAYLQFKVNTEDKFVPNYPENPVIKQSVKLLAEVKIRLGHICNHEIIEDDIDYDYDKTKRIYYCSKCETTF